MEKVIKRDGLVVDFNPDKIIAALAKALNATGEDPALAPKIGAEVAADLEQRFGRLKPHVEDIQDLVEQNLIKNGKYETAKAYILYRQRRAELRDQKDALGVRDSLKLSLTSLRVLKERYLIRDPDRGTTESPTELFRRVARAIAQPDANYGSDPATAEEEFYQTLVNLEFLPNSPTLMNAGTKLGQLAACFVLPVDDSLAGIFDTLKYAALIHQSGGGTGFSFSRIRPKGDLVRSTMGVASGPVSFMKIYDRATEVIKQGGKRRGANMGVLRVDHPDILEFVRAKEQEGDLENFNISVAVTDDFMNRTVNNQSYDLVNPRTGRPVQSLNAREVFEMIVMSAWRSGDPGMIFIDEVNWKNPTPELGMIETTNPCGEVPLLPFESCNLGSVNLMRMFVDNRFDYQKLGRTVRRAVHFLDNVIDANHYPLPEIEKMAKGNRKIGLGIMGFADCLIRMGIPYDSEATLEFAEELMSFIQQEARKASAQLAEKRGSFPNIGTSIFKNQGSMRNATVTSIAPTGTISTIADSSSGIEPLFSVGYLRNALDTTFLVVNPRFEETIRRRGLYSADLISEIVQSGSIKRIGRIPEDIRRLFPIAHEILPEFHVKVQAVFQKYVDNAVSKTINLPANAGIEQTQTVFMLAHRSKCKGITVYRYGSKRRQALEFGDTALAESCGRGICNF
jgi:ribonucleoside-diphosphate reductase alpha chain